MTGQSDPLALASDFPPATHEGWHNLVEAALKGASFDQKLVRRTYDDLEIQPLYRRAEQAAPIAGRPHAAPWQVMQRVDHPDAAAANAQCLEDLQNGATGLMLTFAGSVSAHGYGLAASSTDIAAALGGVFLDAIPLELDLPADSHVAGFVAGAIKQRGVSPGDTQVRFGLNPMGALALGRIDPGGWKDQQRQFVRAIDTLRDAGFMGPLAVADGRVIHNGGGSEAQELAFVLASAVTFMRALEKSGLGLDAARDTLFFRLSADAQQFLTLAKFRAMRKLWARVEQVCDIAPKPIHVSAETAWRMMTRRDPWVNILRTTVATVGAGLGGADTITVLPFTLAIGLPDAMARRLARNTQSILLDESHLAKVSDPAAGAGAIEDMTTQLCEAAWTLLQEIEAADGLPAALASGMLQAKVAAVRARRLQAVAHRTDAMTGTSEFPHLAELPVQVLAPTPLVPPPKLEPPPERGRPRAQRSGRGSISDDGKGPPPRPSPLQGEGADTFAPLAPIRLSEPFERLREASDAHLATTGKRPSVFLANLGRRFDFTARATFAKNLFEAGGIAAITGDVSTLPLRNTAASPLPGGERSAAQRPGEGDQPSPQSQNPSPAPPPTATERPLPMGEVSGALNAMAAAFKASGAALVCLCSSDALYAEQALPALQALAAAGAETIYVAGRPGNDDALSQAGVKAFIYAGCAALAILQEAHDIIGMTAGAPERV